MFCNKCGTQLEETQQYCNKCGDYLKRESIPLQVTESSFNFCRHCGSELNGRYCITCGMSSVQTVAKLKSSAVAMEQIKQTKVAVENIVKTGLSHTINKENVEKLKNLKGISNVRDLKIEAPSKENVLKWVKQGAIFAAIVLLISLAISFTGGMMLKSKFIEEYRYLDQMERDTMNTLANMAAAIYAFLWGGKSTWDIKLGTQLQGHITFMLPFLGIIVAVFVTWVSEKIRVSISKEKLTAQGSAIMAAIGAVGVVIGGLVVSKSFRLTGSDLDEVGYGYYDFEYIKLGSSIDLISTFIMSFLVMLLVFILIIKIDEKTSILVESIKKIVLTILGFSSIAAIAIIGKILFEQRENIDFAMQWDGLKLGSLLLAVLIAFIYLTGLMMTMLVTGNFDIMEIITNAESVLKLKISTLNISYEHYGISDKASWSMKWWFVFALLLTLVIVFAIAYQLWKDRTLTLQEAAKEAGVLGVGVGAVTSLIARMSGSSLEMQVKVGDYYFDNFDNLFDLRNGKYHFVANSGNVSVVKTWLTVGLIVFVLAMVMYVLQSKNVVVLDQVMSYINMKTIWIAIGVVCIILLAMFDIYDIGVDFEYFLEQALMTFIEPLENFMSVF